MASTDKQFLPCNTDRHLFNDDDSHNLATAANSDHELTIACKFSAPEEEKVWPASSCFHIHQCDSKSQVTLEFTRG